MAFDSPGKYVAILKNQSTKPANVEPFHPGPPAQHGVLAKTATLLAITGALQAPQGVVHPVADRLWKPQVGRAPTIAPSRNFH